ncbi:GNAT family N-acetyltransferase [Actinocrinis sp.]|uniref:GNAT family N-acetyltransferase n=1 Tax=Actinocrinis sp. TaxID=1920516 RepID=UPI002DDD79E5|nr:GNAT family N-acetyltransferase [Actinocrinis sp.]
MITVNTLKPDDRAAWESLFAGYHEFYGRPNWPQENYDRAWQEFQAADRMPLFELDRGRRRRVGRRAAAGEPTAAYKATVKFEEPRMHALGARLDERLVGIAHYLVHPSTSSADVCYLQDLFTAPDARGRGVARALIAAVEASARDGGCARVYWHTQAANATARRLYDQVAENRGFIQYVIQL